MDRKQFHILVNNATALSADEAASLLLLEKEFPYSQVIRCLAARATQDRDLPEHEEQLHLGAIYTTDRSVFKSFMTAKAKERKATVIEAIEKSVVKVEISNPQLDDIVVARSGNFSGDTLYDEVMEDLARLQESKHRFEETVKKLETESHNSTIEIPVKKKNDDT